MAFDADIQVELLRARVRMAFDRLGGRLPCLLNCRARVRMAKVLEPIAQSVSVELSRAREDGFIYLQHSIWALHLNCRSRV